MGQSSSFRKLGRLRSKRNKEYDVTDHHSHEGHSHYDHDHDDVSPEGHHSRLPSVAHHLEGPPPAVVRTVRHEEPPEIRRDDDRDRNRDRDRDRDSDRDHRRHRSRRSEDDTRRYRSSNERYRDHDRDRDYRRHRDDRYRDRPRDPDSRAHRDHHRRSSSQRRDRHRDEGDFRDRQSINRGSNQGSQDGFGDYEQDQEGHLNILEAVVAAAASRRHQYSDLPPPPLHPNFRTSRCTGAQKALCIGINYRGQPKALKGCTNDARNARRFLLEYAGFRRRDVLLLTDDPDARSSTLPTKKNMIDGMRWLVKDAQPDDSLFFHYSGHGGQVEDESGEEEDGYNEVIFPLDHRKVGHIVDNVLHECLVTPLPEGCRLTAVFDSCHSGTTLDLPCIYSESGELEPSLASSRSRQREASPADVIAYTGCKDEETSADTVEGGSNVGAMSYALLRCLKAHSKQSHIQLLDSVRDVLKRKYHQKPQLSSSHPMDMNTRFIL